MGNLYLSDREAQIVRYAAVVWGALQWWDLADRYVIRKYWPGSQKEVNHATEQTRPESQTPGAATL